MADGVQSIDRAFSVLRVLATASGGVSDVARRTGLPVSTCARLLGSLESLGAVERLDPGPTFRIGPTVAQLAGAVDPGVELVRHAHVHLESLVAAVGETAGISVPDGSRAVRYLDQVDSGQEVTLQDWTGERVPLHVVSSGLVFLASCSTSEVTDYCAAGLERFTEHTTTRAGELRRRLTQIRADGYAWTVEEFADGISSVAAPIRDATGGVAAALHVHGPTYRLRPSNRVVTRAVLATAAQLSRA